MEEAGVVSFKISNDLNFSCCVYIRSMYRIIIFYTQPTMLVIILKKKKLFSSITYYYISIHTQSKGFVMICRSIRYVRNETLN